MTLSISTCSTRKIALTGGIACGKSLVGDYLRQKNIPVIDADDVVHTLLREDEALKAQICLEFGETVFDANHQINRPKLGEQVFASVARRKLLESWIHPKTRETIETFYLENQKAPLGVAIIPLLFESNLETHYDEVWLLETDETTQLKRLRENRGMNHEQALVRIRNQMPAVEKRQRAKQCQCYRLLENRSTPEALFRQLDLILMDLLP